LHILAAACFSVLSASAPAETYFVDVDKGNDENSGTSQATAWRSLDRVNAAHFFPGDEILFKRGMQWRGTLIVSASGSEHAPITFSAYGSGKNPVIVRSVKFSGWRPFSHDGKAAEKTRIWVGSIQMLRTSWGMVHNGKSAPIHRPKSRLDMAIDSMKDGHFYSHRNNGMFYYRNDSGPPGPVEIGAYEEAVRIENKNHIIIDGIDAFGPGGKQKGSSGTWRGLNYKSVAISDHASHIAIRNMSISYANSIGIWTDPTTSNIMYENLVAHHNGGTGIYMNSNGGRISNCRSFDNGRLEDGAGDRGGIGSFKGRDITIERNEVFRNGPDNGNSDFEVSLVQTGIMKVQRNHIHDCLQGCLQIAEGGNGSTIAYNVISGYGSADIKMSSAGKLSGIRIGGGVGGAKNVHIYNNVLHGGKQDQHAAEAALFIAPFDNSGLRVMNNVFAGNENRQIYVKRGRKVRLDNVQFSSNLYSSLKTGIYWKGKDINTLEDLHKTPQLGVKSLVSDPLFINLTGTFSKASDFALQSNSPAINRGVDLGIQSDYSNEPVPYGASPDIGAFEFHAIGE
jgi:hypothetical protein